MLANSSRTRCRAPEVPETRPSHRPLSLRLLQWLVRCNQRHRNRQKLSRLPAERLEDMGITPEEVRRIFER
ncbi:DUF1127 domain-containing protein [Puniceibacterium confluentis]|uniref:DUF1127 domain-containing protein n=1 Tax=Puniceibacterium confluentis TaxID=1958944 RepID=UPI0011B5D137